MKCRKVFLIFVILSLMASYMNIAAAEEVFKATVVDDFEFKDSRANWFIQNTSNAELSLSAQQAHSGKRSLKYRYNYKSGEYGIISTEWSRGGTLINNIEKYKYMGCWVYGNAEGLQFAIEAKDGEGSVSRYGFTTINFEGWKYIEFPLASGIIPDFRFYQFIIKKSESEFGNSGEIYIDDLTFSENSYYATEGVDNQIAGMQGVGESGGAAEGMPTLTEVSVPPVTREKPQTAQQGNENPFQMLKYKTSDKLPDSISGVALSDDGTALSIMPGSRGTKWAAGWLNDGESLYGKVDQTTYSSGMHSSAGASEWVMLTFPQNERINKIHILARDKKGCCFPVNYILELSTDGENWKTVADVKNFVYKDEDFNPVVHEFQTEECKYLRLTATKLSHDGNPSTYYMQIREIEAYDENGENVALYTHGTEAVGGNPLTTNAVSTYEEYFNNIFDSGVKWVNIPNVTFWGKEPNQGQIDNMRLLKENGVNITYRFTHSIPEMSEQEAEEEAKAFAENVKPYVTALKDYIDVWQISNEENFPGKSYSDLKPKAYAKIVGTVAQTIRALDPGCKIEIETALIDFGWTKAVMEAGLAGKIDIMGVHVYKETSGASNMIEENGTFIKNGTRHFPDEHPYKDYREEITEYKKLLQSYNPECELWCTETSINRGSNSYCVTELVQAKYLAREYIYHQMLGVGPTYWWALNMIKTGDIEWGLMGAQGEKLDGWYALRNVANTMNNNYKIDESITAEFSTANEMIYDCFNDGKTCQIPYWVRTNMRSANTGCLTDITVTGIDVKNAVCIDTITGTVQKLNYEKDGDAVVFKDMIARDYPLIIRINSDEEYDEYNAQDASKTPEKPISEKIISNAVILDKDSDFGLVRGRKKEITKDDNKQGVIIIDGTSYVPVRFIAEAINKKVYWLNGIIVISDQELDIDSKTEEELKEYFNNEKGREASQ